MSDFKEVNKFQVSIKEIKIKTIESLYNTY